MANLDLMNSKIVGTLCFPGDDMDVTNDTSHFFEAISEIQPTVFFGPPSAYERIYHHFREMKKHTSGENTYLLIYKTFRMLVFRGAGEAGPNWAELQNYFLSSKFDSS